MIQFVKNKIKEIYKHRHPEYILNINQDLTNKEQKRVLLCYIKDSFRINFDKNAIFHPNLSRCVQMVTTLVKLGFSVDVCDYNDLDVLPVLSDRRYHAIIGFGPLYEAMCKSMSIKNRIIYVTENDPRLLVGKYQERKMYFQQRHPNVRHVPTSDRIEYYTASQFDLSNKAIIMTSECNSTVIRKQIPYYAKIKVNGMVNENYIFKIGNIIERRKNFLWFGSTGFIQKGLDIIVDAFKELPYCTLNVYGLPKHEIKQLRRIGLPSNVHICGMVSVQSQDFIDIVNNNLFIISASCMEGMQSGVATCMRHGMIPMLTKECGYESDSPVILFKDYKVETIVDTINDSLKIDANELIKMSKDVYKYSNENHTLDSFSDTFCGIIKQMIS